MLFRSMFEVPGSAVGNATIAGLTDDGSIYGTASADGWATIFMWKRTASGVFTTYADPYPIASNSTSTFLTTVSANGLYGSGMYKDASLIIHGFVVKW